MMCEISKGVGMVFLVWSTHTRNYGNDGMILRVLQETSMSRHS